MQRNLSLLLALALALCTACGGPQSAHTELGAPAAWLAPPALALDDFVPAVPEAQPFIAQRMSASAQVQLQGDQTYALSQFNAAPASGKLQLNSQVNAVSTNAGWGMYRFGGAPGEILQAMGCTANVGSHPKGQVVWLGISDYQQHRWRWFDGGLGVEVALNQAPGKFVSSGGQTYVVVVAFGGMQFDVNSVYVRYPTRQTVSGKVQLSDGTPIPGALVASPAFQTSVLTGSDGSFSIGLPKGSWPIVTTKNGYTFYSNPEIALVDAAPVGGIVITGRQNGSHFDPADPGPNDNTLPAASPIDLSSGPVSGTLSATDDPVDCLTFTVPAAGQYALEFRNAGLDIYFPFFTLYNTEGIDIISAPSPAAGTMRIPVLCGKPNQQFKLQLSCSGGGGAYTLGLSSGSVQHLAGLVTAAGGVPLSGCVVTATNSAQGDVTQYLTDATGAYEDFYRAPVTTLVTSSGANISFTPPQQNVALGSGPAVTIDFTGNVAALPDSYEPNNSPDDASFNGVVDLPYDSTGSHNLSVTAGSDAQDFFKVSPPHGAGLKAEVMALGDHPTESALALNIISSNGFTTLATGYVTPAGLTARLAGVTTESFYYIRVAGGTHPQRSNSYTLKISSFPAFPLNFVVKTGALKAVPDAVIQLRQPGDAGGTPAYKVHQLTTLASGITPAEYFGAGEQLQAELFRYGFDIDRQTKAITMPAAALTIEFDANPAASLDQQEPNNTIATAVPLTLPLSLEGTLDPVSDPRDNLLLTVGSTDPLLFKLDETTPPGVTYRVNLQDNTGFSYGTTLVTGGGPGKLLFPPSAGQFVVGVDLPTLASSYHLTVKSTPAFHLKGTATNSGNPLNGLTVYCPELPQTFQRRDPTSAYDFGLVPPGTYTLIPYSQGAFPSQAQATVTITNADNGANFSFITQQVDALEPNNTPDDAKPLPNDGTVTSGLSVGGMADGIDAYTFEATAGQLVHISIVRGQPWWPDFAIQTNDPADEFVPMELFRDGATQDFTFVAAATGTYLMGLNGGPGEYSIAVKAGL